MKIKATFEDRNSLLMGLEIEVTDLNNKIIEMSIQGYSLASIYNMPEGAIMKSYIKHLYRLQDAEDMKKLRIRTAA